MIPALHYLEWCEPRYAATRFDLGSSGIPAAPASMLGSVHLSDEKAKVRFREGIARRYGVDSANVTTALGATHAIWLVCAAGLEPADEVLVEHPTYEPLHAVPRGFGAAIHHFEQGSLPDIERKLTPRTKLVFVSRLHNPTARNVSEDYIRTVLSLAKRHGATLVVDEVYAEFAPEPSWTAHTIDERIIALSSLTKRWGVGWARAGWILATPDWGTRFRTASFHCPGDLGAPHAAIGEAALIRLPELEARASEILEGKIELADAWIQSRSHLSWEKPVGGTFGFVRVAGVTDTRPIVDRMIREDGVIVAPGAFFGVSNAFRLGMTAPREDFKRGLDALDKHFGRGAQ